MKIKNWLLFSLLCFLIPFSSCQDKDVEKGLQPDENQLFLGTQRVITFKNETKDFHYRDFICRLKAGDGTVFTRKGEHLRMNGESILTLCAGLMSGEYTMLALQYPVVEATGDTTWVEFGLGCRIKVNGIESVKILDKYDEDFGLFGEGTESEPYRVASYDHLKRIRNLANNDETNKRLTPKTYFKQVADINMDMASWQSDHSLGWYPIGSQVGDPFRGVYDGGGYSIEDLWSFRSTSSGIGLFGYVEQAYIKHVNLKNPRIEGMFAVGSLVGGNVTRGDECDTTFISSCHVSSGYVKAGSGSVGVGGIVGVTDMKSVLLIDSCTNVSTPVTGDYAVGGILGAGAQYSFASVQQCENSASISSAYTGAGGIAGSVDSLYVLACYNKGAIMGSTKYKSSDKENGGIGTGGIVGGSGTSYIYSSQNEGTVQGVIGVGGIIGSTRVTDELYNDTMLRSCSNSASIKGESAVGGMCGEAQIGCYKVYNKGTVESTGQDSHVGGIVGNSSIAVLHNAMNVGEVVSSKCHCAGGIVGKTNMGALFACQNYGKVDVTADYTGGVVGLAGNYTMVNYCSNFAYIINNGKGPTGGIIGEIGDPREWSGWDIANCVIGGVEIALGILGPALTLTEDAAKAAGGVWKTLHTALHVSEVISDISTVIYDTQAFIRSSVSMANEKEKQLIATSLTSKISAVDSKITDEMSAVRNGFVINSGLLAKGITAGGYSKQVSYLNNLLTFYESSGENCDLINYNINKKREERYENIEKANKASEIFHKVIGGVCIVGAAIGTIAGIAAAFVTGGSSIVVAIGAISTVVGGVNAIWETAADYQNNVVVVSQCNNMGQVKAPNADKVGGILAHAQQKCEILDCVNSGPLENAKTSSSGGIVGRTDSKALVKNCVNVGMKWGKPIVGSFASSSNFENTYFYIETGAVVSSMTIPLNLEQLYNPNSYKKFSMTGSRPKWQVTQSTGNYPIPCHSEMEEPAE